MVYQGFYEILMITLISRKKLGGYKIMRYTVYVYKCLKSAKERALLGRVKADVELQ